MRSLILKAGATVLTVAATLVSALYVTSHLKNPSAPLQPVVLSAWPDGAVNLTPAVQQSDLPPMTSTYAS